MTKLTVYTDLGPDLQMVSPDGTTTNLPRYGVWKWDEGRQKHQVAEVGDDLEALRAKHGEGPLVDRAQLTGNAGKSD